MKLLLVTAIAFLALACDKTIHEVRLDPAPQHLTDSTVAMQSAPANPQP